MPTLSSKLEIERCPHCNVAKPDLSARQHLSTNNHSQNNLRIWKFYACSTCGGIVTASAPSDNGAVREIFPKNESVDEAVPAIARAYLTQALQSLHAPAGAVMLAASAVDAMLKDKNYKTGNLYGRIEKAASDHIITNEMAKWAHEVRLDANDQRHADEVALLPTEIEAKKCIDFAKALGEFMFVLPSRVQRGIAEAAKQNSTSPQKT
jgi:hypothetical protein